MNNQKSIKNMIEKLKSKISSIKTKAQEKREEFIRRITDYEKRLEDKSSQIDILRSRIANLEKEREEAKRNPFAGLDKSQIAAAAGIDVNALDAFTQAASNGAIMNNAEPVETDLTKLYGVTEIRGRGDELIARLVNKNGTAFYVKKGTSLQSGHVVTKITTTYVLAEKIGDKQYLYFAAGGILPTEVSGIELNKNTDSENPEKK